jgi:hypothetical protein
MMIADMLHMSFGDSMLAIVVGLLGAFLLHVGSKLLVYAAPFHVSYRSFSISLKATVLSHHL